MVLAEDDYIEYLIRLVEEGSTKDDRSMIPPVVHAALRTKPLLFIGYSLHDWTFLVLFRTLLRDVDTSYRRRHVSVQLEPPMAEDIGSAKTYLEEAFRERHIAIFWESTESFTSELARRMWGEAR
uniref:Uncharacterized protein n=2 Tax=Nonomuraea gerenzanensis TaxID=93944 RepID=A0A1M4EBV2_9ACTN|nr:hypothetical protein BN4615_P5933 [Nonomuraea gerenzanensis]